MKQDIRGKTIITVIRMLAWRNGLEGFLSMVGLLWGASALAFPDYWALACAGGMQAWVLTPPYLGWVLIITGTSGILSLALKWRYLRMQSSVVAFIVWGLMAVWSFQIPAFPVADDVAIYSAFATAELVIYVRILAGLDPSMQATAKDVAIIGRRHTDHSTRSNDDAGDH